MRVLLALLSLEARDEVVAGGGPQDAVWRVRRGQPARHELPVRGDDRAERRPAVGVHDDAIARPHLGVGAQSQERLRPSNRRQLDGNDRW